MSNIFDFAINNKGVANINFNLKDEKVNKLNSLALLELESKLEEYKNNQKINILVFSSSKNGIFIAGADINEIKDIKNLNEANDKVTKGQNILNKISNLPFPTVSLINGACLGGGLELALACKYRIATDNTKVTLGLPEVSLGIIPGFGGTQRLPKLIGLMHSLSMILSGKAINSKKAYKIGLVDEIFREEFTESSLEDFIETVIYRPKRNQYLIKRSQSKRSRFRKETLLFGKFFIYKYAKKDLLKKTKGHYPAPLEALKVIEDTYNISEDNIKKGLEIEAKHFSQLAISKISKNLIDIFFISEEMKKDNFIENKDELPQIKNVGLVGAGIMGGGIAWLFSNYDISLRMKDISKDALALGFKQVEKIYNQLKKIRKYNSNQVNNKVNNISSTLTYEGFQESDVVIEAIIEDINIKKAVIADLEKNISAKTIIASNTSSISITEMSKALKNPQRFVGMHFFNPVNRMPLVEVIQGKKTSKEAVASIVNLSKRLGKTPIVVQDVAGFLVNRILIPYINEAGFLIEDGGDIKLIDDLIEKFGMPVGPFTLADSVGIDVGFKVAKILEKSYGNRMKVCDILEYITQDKNLLGKKTGQGFFTYDKNGKKIDVNPKINSLLDNINISKADFCEEDIVDRCIYIMINEAVRCLEEGVVKNARYLDMAMIMGTGFPPFRGGLLKYCDDFGIKNVVDKMNNLNRKYGKRFSPAKLLIDMANKNKSFYEDTRN